jgi:hypothetical protein
MEIIGLLVFIIFVSWFYTKTGGYHNYLTEKKENAKLTEAEDSRILNNLPEDLIENFNEYSSGTKELKNESETDRTEAVQRRVQ